MAEQLGALLLLQNTWARFLAATQELTADCQCRFRGLMGLLEVCGH